MERSPPWRESEPNPPFPAREALRLAEHEKSRLVNDNQRNGVFWYLDRVTLQPWEDDLWYWEVSYKVHFDREHLYGLTLAVLMDGVLVHPKEYGIRDDERLSIYWARRPRPPSWPAKEKVYSSLEDGDLVTTISSEMLHCSPPWRRNEPNPPLSARKALVLAEREKARLIATSGGSDLVWRLDSVSLVPRADDRWYWVIEYQGAPGGALGGFPYILDLVVLMDGTLVPPKELRHTRSPFMNGRATPQRAE